MITIKPVSFQQIDFTTLNAAYMEEAPVVELNTRRMQTGTLASFLQILLIIKKGRGQHPNKLLADRDLSIFRHLFYSFVFEGPIDCQLIREQTELSVLCGSATLASGTLDKWILAIDEFCSTKYDFQTRLLFNKLLLIFESAGLGLIWDNMCRQTLPDHSFTLREKQ